MDAFRKLIELVRGNLVFLHILRIAVAMRTRRRNVPRVNRRSGVLGRKDVVTAVAARALRDLRISLDVSHAVDTRPILVKLVDRQRGIVAPHECGISVACGASLDNVQGIDR